MELSIICPVFNEEDNILPFVNEVKNVLETIQISDYQIIFVLDKSKDNSFEVLKNLSAQEEKIKVLHLSARYGHQESIIAGMEYSLKAKMIITMDVDLQHPPSLIPKLVDEMKKGYDIVITKRILNKDYSLIRKITGNLFYNLNNLFSDTKIMQGSADFRIISQRVATHLIEKFPERDFFLRGIISLIGFNHTFIEYSAKKREFGNSKFNNFKKIQFAITGIMSLSTRPLYIRILFGIIFAILSLISLFIMIFNYIYNGNISQGWTSIISIILAVSTIQFFLIGIIGFYVGSIFKEIKNRPRYLIQDKINLD